MSGNLFKPLKVGNMDLTNRVVMAPMTRLRAPDHVPLDETAEYYEQRAQYPGTLLITDATGIRREDLGMALIPGIWNDAQEAAHKKVFDRVHAAGSYAFLQLWAMGRASSEALLDERGYDYVGPSPIQIDGHTRAPRALTIEEIKQYKHYFVDAANRAIAAGADGVEIHGANGFLPDQFLQEISNTRTDEYGGSIENRARFMLEIIDALIEAVGAERVAVRLSPWGKYNDMAPGIHTYPTFTYVVSELEKRAKQGKRLAYIHLIEAREDEHENDDLNTFNDVFYHIWKGPVVTASNLTHVADKVADQNDRTLVALGRYWTSNPDLVQRLKDKSPLTPYDRETFYWDGKADPKKGFTDFAVQAQA